MIRPQRLQLRRTARFNLQAISLAINGLPAISVARPHAFGNMFVVAPTKPPGSRIGAAYFAVPTVEDAVACFREVFDKEGETADALRALLPKVRGHNVACWCRHGEPCHGDVWLELANS
jgi:hypothetical protein